MVNSYHFTADWQFRMYKSVLGEQTKALLGAIVISKPSTPTNNNCNTLIAIEYDGYAKRNK
jgi:hypothetical protein